MSEVRQNEAAADDKNVVFGSVPERLLVCIEHPGIVKNNQNAINTLGGDHIVNRLLKSTDRRRSIGLSWRPDDPLAKRTRSRAVETNDLLLKVTLPKRTGRRRKRGSGDPYEYENASFPSKSSEINRPYNITASDLLNTFNDRPEKISVAISGHVQETYRFRDIPDFQTSMTDQLTCNFRHNLLNQYSKWKGFKSDFQVDKPCAGVLPPPVGGQVTIPFNFAYMQNLAMKKVVGKDGKVTAVNTQMAAKSYLLYCSPASEAVPATTPAVIPPEDTLDPLIRETIASLRKIMQGRPIVTRRAIGNLIPECYDSHLRLAYPYVGYSFRKGPWKDSIIKYGVDPRSDAKNRFYQTVLFKLFTGEDSDNRMIEQSKQGQKAIAGHIKTKSHIFDGKILHKDGKVWQVCDIKDSLLRDILNTTEVRTKCESYRDGWYHSGTWGKFKAIMKDKLDDLLAGKIPRDIAYRRIKDFPDQLEREHAQLASFTRSQRATEKEMAISIFIRYWVRHQVVDGDKREDDDGKEQRKQAGDAQEDADEVIDEVCANDASEDNGTSSKQDSDASDAVDFERPSNNFEDE